MLPAYLISKIGPPVPNGEVNAADSQGMGRAREAYRQCGRQGAVARRLNGLLCKFQSRVRVGISVRNRAGAVRSIRALIRGGLRPVRVGSNPTLLILLGTT